MIEALQRIGIAFLVCLFVVAAIVAGVYLGYILVLIAVIAVVSFIAYLFFITKDKLQGDSFDLD